MIRSLTYEQLNEVESHFLFAEAEARKVAEITKDIAEESSYSMNPTGVHGTSTSDATAIKASRIEKKTRILKGWGEVVKETREHFKKDPLMSEIFKMLYRDKKPYREIINRLFIGQTSFFEYKKEILRYAAMRAVAKGLMDI